MKPTPADPDAWNAYLTEGTNRPRQRVTADVLIRDTTGRVLLVDFAVRPGWDLPGVLAADNEPPEQAAARLLREELGLTVRLRGLLTVDWVAPHGRWDAQFAFVFDGGMVNRSEQLHLEAGELTAARFMTVDESWRLARPDIHNRLVAAVFALGDGRPAYLHDGQPVWGL